MTCMLPNVPEGKTTEPTVGVPEGGMATDVAYGGTALHPCGIMPTAAVGPIGTVPGGICVYIIVPAGTGCIKNIGVELNCC